ncbi:hypothetical protein [Christiangramia flava]|uniref:Uncharacterized protein n=1 Tax=Christiangramia flava JLT2011 TaxID=1229726 RepID=A0A1L7I7J4_9FLAO|nr:hypothetical protein [Christiangramia flava]APU69560.1 hypothetical protein GRFL_2836 [Christiangramia flava JLT2011]OSS37463.1 hypothetical protein C723_3626 [Christiangramia flava JLT2011]
MKIYHLILISFLLIQCAENNNRKADNESFLAKKSVNDTNTISVSNHIVEKIKNYYLNGEGAKFQFESNDFDSLKELIFKSSDNFTLMRIEIPKKEIISDSIRAILFPDFNNDGLKDVVINVYREGGWGGGNVFDNEIFVFKNEENSFILKSVNNSKKLTDCDTGQFSLVGLKKGKLIGNSFCYTPDDGHCCPSLKYYTVLSEENWKLKHFTSEETY